MRSGRRLALWLGLAGVLLGSRAAAQTLAPGPPGPFVIDVRGATSGIPSGPGLYPTLAEEARVPVRGFGGDLGGHVYPLKLGPARLGIGVNLIYVRGTSVDTHATVRIIDPQISFNFGTANGWSYLSAGLGTAHVNAGRSGLGAGDQRRRRRAMVPHAAHGGQLRHPHAQAGGRRSDVAKDHDGFGGGGVVVEVIRIRLANRSSFKSRTGPPSRVALRWATFAGDHERRLERETGIEPATSSLGSSRSTAELLPRSCDMLDHSASPRLRGWCTTGDYPRITSSTSSRFFSISSGVVASRLSRSSGSVFEPRTLKCQSG